MPKVLDRPNVIRVVSVVVGNSPDKAPSHDMCEMGGKDMAIQTNVEEKKVDQPGTMKDDGKTIWVWDGKTSGESVSNTGSDKKGKDDDDVSEGLSRVDPEHALSQADDVGLNPGLMRSLVR
ncbi:hypothetical protein NDU88_004603 [Pleurodeles waltl]|uniref:Uncharacterized protein n=1 Tax=Pleurodeles waltl TaxID=8319 RepID=A0AAV7WWA8_PLEWA|nr:hypothetical protein NDU88_004603 [Pleurodeles waltl]